MIQLNTLQNNVSFYGKMISQDKSLKNSRPIDISGVTSEDLSRLSFEINQLISQKQAVSIYSKANCELLKAITGYLPGENKGIQITANQQRNLGLYFESIPAYDDHIKAYLIRLKDNYFFVSIKDNDHGKPLITPVPITAKKYFGKEATLLGQKYYGGELEEKERALLASIYKRSIKSQLSSLENRNCQNIPNFKIPQITNRAPRVAFINFTPDNQYLFPSIGTNYLESHLENKLCKDAISIINMDVQIHSDEEIKRKLEDFQPDIIGISTKVNTHQSLDKWMKYLEEHYPDQLKVLGGTLATYAFNEILEENPGTLLVLENGEIPMEELMKIVIGQNTPDSLEKIPNLAYKSKNKVVLTPYQPFNMSSNFKPSDSNIQEIIQKGGTLALRWSQGCWGNCTFCTHPGKWEGSSVDKIVSVLKYFKEKFNIKSVFFTDDEVVPKDPVVAHSRLEEFADKLIKENLNISWTVSLRADCIHWLDAELLGKLKKSGCNSFFIGIESGSDTQLTRYGKSVHGIPVTVELNEKALKFFRDNDIKIGVGWIPFDPAMPTLKELKDNMDFFKRNNLFDFNVRMNNALRAQKGSSYLTTLGTRYSGILGELQPNKIFYDTNYIDPRVGTIKDHVDVWTNEISELESTLNVIKFDTAVDPSLKEKHKDILALGKKLQHLTYDYIIDLMSLFPESEEDKLINSKPINNPLLKDKEFMANRRNMLLAEVTLKRKSLFEITQRYRQQRDVLIHQFKRPLAS